MGTLFANLTVLENVAYPMRVVHVPIRRAKSRAKEILDSAGLGCLDVHQCPAMRAGGRQQRASMASDAEVLLADEPTGNLDSGNGKIVMGLLKRPVGEENCCMIVATYGMGTSAKADVAYCMKDGHITKEG